MARKDRERARKRHAIDRARRESGWEPAPKEEQPAPGRRRGRDRRPAGRRPVALPEGQVGDVDRKGGCSSGRCCCTPRSPSTSTSWSSDRLVSRLRRDPTLQAVGYGAFASHAVIADSKTTWMRALPFIILAVALAAGAVALAVGLG